MPGAIEGIRVLDLARGVAGPYAAMLLAEQGADVLRLEPPSGDRLSDSPPYFVFNRSKRIATADAHTTSGRAEIAVLLSDADVVVVDLPEAAAKAIGLDYASISVDHPGLVYVAMPPYGSRGPLANEDADDALIAAAGGISGGQWSGGEQPVDMVIPIAGYGAALLAAGAVAAALYERARSGQGQRVEVSLLAGALAMQTGSLLRGLSVERLAGTAMDPLGPIPVYRLYRAADGRYLFIAAGTPRFFQRLCLLLDHPEWISDERWSDAPWGIVDPGHRRAMAEQIAPIIASKPRDEWLRLLTEADIPNAPVATRDEFINHPQTAALGLRVELDDPEAGPMVQMGTPVRLHGTPGPNLTPRQMVTTGAWLECRQAPPGPSNTQHPTPNTASGPLAGLRVLDLSGFIAGAYCPMMLADFGADVIKVESPDGDAFRGFGFGFLGWNRGKRAISVDTRRPEGQAVVHDLVRTADIVVENFRPGAAKWLGLDYETLAAINPRLIYSSVSAFGDVGPDAGGPGFDPLLQARSGIMAAQGGMDRGHPPVYLTAAICDYAAALLSVYGICAALVARERTGRGQRVETTLVHSALAAQAGEFIWYEGRPPWPVGAPGRLGASTTDRLYAAEDGWIRIELHDLEHWQALLRALGPPYRLWEFHMLRAAWHDPPDGPIAVMLADAIAHRSLDQLVPALREAGVPVAALIRPSDLFNDPQVIANDLLASHDHAYWGPIHQTGVLTRFSRTPGAAQRAAPLLGQHSHEVLREAGYDDTRIAALIRDGIVIQT